MMDLEVPRWAQLSTSPSIASHIHSQLLDSAPLISILRFAPSVFCPDIMIHDRGAKTLVTPFYSLNTLCLFFNDRKTETKGDLFLKLFKLNFFYVLAVLTIYISDFSISTIFSMTKGKSSITLIMRLAICNYQGTWTSSRLRKGASVGGGYFSILVALQISSFRILVWCIVNLKIKINWHFQDHPWESRETFIMRPPMYSSSFPCTLIRRTWLIWSVCIDYPYFN